MNMPKIQPKITLPFIFLLVSVVLVVFSIFYVGGKIMSVEKAVKSLKEGQASLEDSIQISVYEDHLKLSEQVHLKSEVETLSTQFAELNSIPDNQEYAKIKKIYDSYSIFSTKINRNIPGEVDTSAYSDKVISWGEKLLEKDFDTVQTEIDASIETLDTDYEKYLASIAPPPAPVVTEGTSGSSNYMQVDTEVGKFGVYYIKIALSDVKVITSAANDSDCKDNCPTKSLADHVKDNNGFAGMNGAYFCPPDYSTCAGKINSSDYALYKSSSSKWLNKDALSWGDTGLATFKDSSAKFYKKSSDYGGGSVTAGISNYPTLLSGGNIVVDNGKLTSYQRDVRGARGAIGVGKTNLYLAVVSNATVTEAAHVMRALGAIDALNLDGGGSAALYLNGSYIVGPGRSLPNAVVLVGR